MEAKLGLLWFSFLEGSPLRTRRLVFFFFIKDHDYRPFSRCRFNHRRMPESSSWVGPWGPTHWVFSASRCFHQLGEWRKRQIIQKYPVILHHVVEADLTSISASTRSQYSNAFSWNLHADTSRSSPRSYHVLSSSRRVNLASLWKILC